jgi:RHS repeat-associated protein
VTTTNYVWDSTFALPQLVLERDGTGTTLRSYAYGSQRISLTNAAGTFFYGYDALGGATGLTDSAGDLAATYSFDPYGAERASTGSVDNPMRFAGEYQDTGSGLYNLRARSYDTATGRFGGLDPLAHGIANGAPSSYIYAGDNPTSFIDPSGMGKVHPCGTGLGCYLSSFVRLEDVATLAEGVTGCWVAIPVGAEAGAFVGSAGGPIGLAAGAIVGGALTCGIGGVLTAESGDYFG